jgi:hypothetical protein
MTPYEIGVLGELAIGMGSADAAIYAPELSSPKSSKERIKQRDKAVKGIWQNK